jgi:hypothetical protein
MSDTIVEFARDIPVFAECDVLVIGGGSAGSTAAIAASRNGASTILVERYGFLGGTGAMVIDTIYGFFTPGKVERKIVGGIPDEVITGLKDHDVVIKRPNTYGSGSGLTYNLDILKIVWDKLTREAGVRVLHHAYFVDCLTEGGAARGALIGTPKGVVAIRAKTVIDASGDAHYAARMGAPFEDSGAMGIAQSLTTTFRMVNVDVERAKAFPKEKMWALMTELDSKYNLPRKEGSSHITPTPGVMATNMTRVGGVDATDIGQLSAAEAEGRWQSREYARFLIDNVPGYENAALSGVSTQIGVRETRRIKGDYWLTREDVLSARQFDDAIALCGAPIEEHHAGSDTRWEYVPDSGTYGIPYRCLLPQGIEGVLVAGRCLSASHDAHASVRSIGQCMAMGQAAGTAAALSVAQNLPPRQIDHKELRTRLAEKEVIL